MSLPATACQQEFLEQWQRASPSTAADGAAEDRVVRRSSATGRFAPGLRIARRGHERSSIENQVGLVDGSLFKVPLPHQGPVVARVVMHGNRRSS
jgi:hypothetical protein